jgi:hypothetical protein
MFNFENERSFGTASLRIFLKYHPWDILKISMSQGAGLPPEPKFNTMEY